jgi:hypothetical protein
VRGDCLRGHADVATLLARFDIATPTTSLHAHNERRAGAKLLDVLQSGKDVALVTDAGTPGRLGSRRVASCRPRIVPAFAWSRSPAQRRERPQYRQAAFAGDGYSLPASCPRTRRAAQGARRAGDAAAIVSTKPRTACSRQ